MNMPFFYIFWSLSHLSMPVLGLWVIFHLIERGRKHWSEKELTQSKKIWWRPKYTLSIVGLIAGFVMSVSLFEQLYELGQAIAQDTLSSPLLTTPRWLHTLIIYLPLGGGGTYVGCKRLIDTWWPLGLEAWAKHWKNWAIFGFTLMMFGLFTESCYVLWLKWLA